MNTAIKKITLSTVKSFIKNNKTNLLINVRSSFDGMTDGLEYNQRGFVAAQATTEHFSNTQGVKDAWFVGGSRDYFTAYNENGMEGIEVSNSCGTFILAIKK